MDLPIRERLERHREGAVRVRRRRDHVVAAGLSQQLQCEITPAQARRLIESGRVDTAQVFFNMINPSAALPVPRRTLMQTQKAPTRGQDFTGLLESCIEKNVGVITIRTLAAGAIVGYMTDYASRIVTKDTDVDDVTRKAIEVQIGRAHV